jgi:hypothetical protein
VGVDKNFKMMYKGILVIFNVLEKKKAKTAA